MHAPRRDARWNNRATVGLAIVPLLAALAIAGTARTAGAGERPLVLRNARLLDGTGAPPRDGVTIVLRDGRIDRIGSDGDVPYATVLDVGGATVLPGLVDAHVHLVEVPGRLVRHDGPGRLNALRRRQLRSYLACGVTTVLDTATPVAMAEEVRRWIAAGHPAPRYRTLGPPVVAPGGYMSSRYSDLAVARVEDLDRVFAAIRRAGGIGVKVPIERGFGRATFLPIHPPELRQAIVRKAAEYGLPIYVHASDEVEQTIALDMAARGLLHLNFTRTPPSPAFVDRLVRSGAYVVTTFSILDAALVRAEPERLDDAVVRLAVPRIERETARDPAAWRAAEVEAFGYVVPWMPRLLRRVFAPRERAGDVRAVLANNLRAAKTLYDAGVPIVIGSDAGNTSVIAQFHGTSTLRETELLAAAGVPPAAVLEAATRTAARMLGLDAEIGTVEVGKSADLIVVDGDPLADIRALRALRWTIRDGVARTPREWMDVRSGRPEEAAR
jgi:imidazolonepropionase-like amidohydrolase